MVEQLCGDSGWLCIGAKGYKPSKRRKTLTPISTRTCATKEPKSENVEKSFGSQVYNSLLKVLHVITISWFWAVFPAILSVTLGVGIFLIVILGIIVLAIIQALVD